MTFSLWYFVSHASGFVQVILLILVLASLMSWTFIIERTLYFRQIKKEIAYFRALLKRREDWSDFYQTIAKYQRRQGLARVFYIGFLEFQRLIHDSAVDRSDHTKRAIQRAGKEETHALEKHLDFLATVGSISPYVGLLGTVWGIMSVFQALGFTNQLAIHSVAPGIAEALMTTALGLLTAIPAVIAYNRLVHMVDWAVMHYDAYQEEYHRLLIKQEAVVATSSS